MGQDVAARFLAAGIDEADFPCRARRCPGDLEVAEFRARVAGEARPFGHVPQKGGKVPAGGCIDRLPGRGIIGGAKSDIGKAWLRGEKQTLAHEAMMGEAGSGGRGEGFPLAGKNI